MVKLIDVHRHLWGFEWFPPSHLRNNAEGLAKKTGRTTEQVLERIAQSPTMDATGQIAIDEMEHYGIDHSVILALDWGMAYGPEEDNKLEYEEFDRLTGEVSDKSKKLSWFCGVDPRLSLIHI